MGNSSVSRLDQKENNLIPNLSFINENYSNFILKNKHLQSINEIQDSNIICSLMVESIIQNVDNYVDEQQFKQLIPQHSVLKTFNLLEFGLFQGILQHELPGNTDIEDLEPISCQKEFWRRQAADKIDKEKLNDKILLHSLPDPQSPTQIQLRQQEEEKRQEIIRKKLEQEEIDKNMSKKLLKEKKIEAQEIIEKKLYEDEKKKHKFYSNQFAIKEVENMNKPYSQDEQDYKLICSMSKEEVDSMAERLRMFKLKELENIKQMDENIKKQKAMQRLQLIQIQKYEGQQYTYDYDGKLMLQQKQKVDNVLGLELESKVNQNSLKRNVDYLNQDNLNDFVDEQVGYLPQNINNDLKLQKGIKLIQENNDMGLQGPNFQEEPELLDNLIEENLNYPLKSENIDIIKRKQQQKLQFYQQKKNLEIEKKLEELKNIPASQYYYRKTQEQNLKENQAKKIRMTKEQYQQWAQGLKQKEKDKNQENQSLDNYQSTIINSENQNLRSQINKSLSKVHDYHNYHSQRYAQSDKISKKKFDYEKTYIDGGAISIHNQDIFDQNERFKYLYGKNRLYRNKNVDEIDKPQIKPLKNSISMLQMSNQNLQEKKATLERKNSQLKHQKQKKEQKKYNNSSSDTSIQKSDSDFEQIIKNQYQDNKLVLPLIYSPKPEPFQKSQSLGMLSKLPRNRYSNMKLEESMKFQNKNYYQAKKDDTISSLYSDKVQNIKNGKILDSILTKVINKSSGHYNSLN
ncbi:hypothetical protein PPERSA_01899 [Pseudocohnilembus persalinus]|uniref:Uncharacterized protein n=1 Tax=Pseudocohnilembus persalinus TaxID=266149 RepID=A0A0V0R3D0_PSEPJ|nr:hypothetical protein PPERSA_01899 [Pseudocohnilembus persalinus]|eukprot:KRX09012.1 hypothetical protein PPERSA_01899 [Pseudocohnilembus persalinus]